MPALTHLDVALPGTQTTEENEMHHFADISAVIWKFVKLRSLVFQHYRRGDEFVETSFVTPALPSVIAPTLETIEVQDTFFAEHVVAFIVNCPMLKSISVRAPPIRRDDNIACDTLQLAVDQGRFPHLQEAVWFNRNEKRNLMTKETEKDFYNVFR